ncbi:hypothetical protein ARMGADRAFT_1034531 [Armillaria gallica]|uniref:Uncharacterized protein n=1 Tax=Armillaria gallica TaxID=47427 RepID=A0A2H3DH69_ARMGA|nr:hypothetical protein ARMGADRAFT_1034531 [Armillaria gallica]
MSVSSYSSVLAAVGMVHLLQLLGLADFFDLFIYFGLMEYNDLVDLIYHVKADFSFPEITDAYNDRSHLYFQYQASILALSDTNGKKLYAAMLDIIHQFETMYPAAVMSITALPQYGLLLVHGNHHHWQYWASSLECKKDAELYAFAMEFVSVHIVCVELGMMLACPLKLDDAQQWLMQCGITVASPVGALASALPALCCLALHFPDALMETASTAMDEHGTPLLLMQLFPSPPPPISFRHYV